jgi:hypothetical protein
MMRNFLAAVLSVIAAGVLLIAYGLLSPRVAAADVYPSARPMSAAQRVGDIEDLTPRFGPAQGSPFDVAQGGMAYRVSDTRAVPVAYDAYPAAPRVTPARVTRTAPVRVERASGRDWTKTAMIIGGTTAAGAGLGAIFGGKKGALIGAAIAGGAGTLYEVKKR